jgi:aminopeptidase N
MLRNMTGDSAFKMILQQFYQQFKGTNADSRDLQYVAESITQKNLGWFFDQWLYRGGVPRLKIERAIDDDGAKVQVRQVSQVYRIPVEIGVTYSDGKNEIFTLNLNQQEGEFKIKKKGIKKIVIDPNVKLLFKEN